MKTRFHIYCFTNKVNGKQYVGQTVHAIESRWKEHVSSAKRGAKGCRVLGAAIRKYGAESFTHELLDVLTTQKSADHAEALWIVQRRSRVPDGYNLAAGGGGIGHLHEETKQLIGEAARKTWADMTPEARDARVLKQIMPRNEDFAQRQSVWQTDQAKARTPEQRSEMTRMAWITRRARYGQFGRGKTKLFTEEQRVELAQRAWTTKRAKYGPSGRTLKKPNQAKIRSELAKLRTPEQRREIALKAWATRIAKYGPKGTSTKPRKLSTRTTESRVESARKAWITRRANAANKKP